MARCDSYTAGQCTRGACLLASWVPDGWGDAGHWPTAAVAAGLAITKIPTVGAIVTYAGGGNGYGEVGHVALVLAADAAHGRFDVKEMNYVAPFVYDERLSTDWDVDFFILPPGVSAGAGAIAPTVVPQGVAGLLVAWGRFQTLWSYTFDQHVSALQEVIGLTNPLSGR